MGSKQTSVKKSSLLCKSRISLENTESSQEEDKMMDFESGIDTWVIDKEDSNGSCYTLSKPESSFTCINTKKTMNKENITKDTSSTEQNSLRCFRIRKDFSYKELSSESETESIKPFFTGDDNVYSDMKQQNALSKVSCHGKKLSNISNTNMSSTSLNELHCAPKEKESLGSEEITLYLSELNSSSDSIHEKSREHLHSIENIASLCESKMIDENTPSQLKLSGNILCPSSEFKLKEELKPCENIPIRISSTSDNNQHSQEQILIKDNISFNSQSLKRKPDFLDSYKTHLTNQLINNENKSKSDSVAFKVSVIDENTSDKYSLCNQQVFKCNVCSYYCSDLLLHKSHLILFHSEKKILDCEYCDYQTSLCANLATHIKVHFQLECPYCDYQCPVQKSLESHLLTRHGQKTLYECKKGDFICKSQIKLKKHSQTHLALSKYQCSNCDLGFKNKEKLKSHVKTHLTKEEAFKCLSCQLSFHKKQQLKIHLRSHEQRYVCNICNFKCTYKQKLEIHMKIHTKKALKCGKCSSIFSRKSNLKLHMRVHFPSSKCQYCPFQSSDLIELSKHICIKNLYNVEKRTLNFESENNVPCESEKINMEKNEVKLSLNSGKVECAEKVKEATKENNNSYVTTKSTQRKKRKPNKRRLSSLRSHLLLQINEKSGNDKKEGEMVNKLRHVDTSHKTLKEKGKFLDKRKHISKTKNNLKQSSWVIDEQGVVNGKKNIEVRKRIKQGQLQSLGLICSKTCFNNKLTPKEILLEPVSLAKDSYIQCYYQSQPSINSPNHLERHIRQNNLLSCRLCNYKTNSGRLLQLHTAKNHTWDPAIVSMLFS